MSGDLAVITPIFLYSESTHLLKAYDRYKKALRKHGVDLFTVEAHLKGHAPKIKKSNFEKELFRVQVEQPLWHKETLINWMVRRLPYNYDKVAWIDGDILLQEGWVEEACQKLDGKKKLLQLGGRFYNLAKDWKSVMSTRQGCGKTFSQFRKGTVKSMYKVLNPGLAFPGLAWAARREFFDEAGMFDEGIVGAGDTLTITSCLGSVIAMRHRLLPLKKSNNSKIERLVEHSSKAAPYVGSGFGFVKGHLYHLWHGEHGNRQYQSRHEIIWNLDWRKDLERDCNGFLEIKNTSQENRKVIEKINAFFNLKHT
jgi:hypothetical protein